MPHKCPITRLEYERKRYQKRPLVTATCSVCSKEKTARRWYKDAVCLACHARRVRAKNPEVYRAADKRRKKPAAQRAAEWRKKNPKRLKELRDADYRRNKHKFMARNQVRRARCKLATPRWLTEEQKQAIYAMYENRPEGMHVDHIVPLRGKNVSGLHVPWNLQYLPAEENNRKNNKY